MLRYIIALFCSIFIFGCESQQVTDIGQDSSTEVASLVQTDRPVLGFGREALIKPFVSFDIDWQFSQPINSLHYVPEDSRTINGKTVSEEDVSAPILMEWRFMKLGLQSQFNDHWRLSFYGDASLNLMYLFDMEINADVEQDIYYAVNYSPVVVPGLKVDLDYFFDGHFFARLGSGIRWYDAVIERGTLTDPDSRNFGGRHYSSVADLTEYSTYLGFGYRYEELCEISLRLGLEYIDTELNNNKIEIERLFPVPFGGFTFEYRW